MKLPKKDMNCPCDRETGQRLLDFLKANGVPMYVDDYQRAAFGLAYYEDDDRKWSVHNDHADFARRYPEDNVTPSEFCAAFGLAWPENTNQ